MTVRIGDEQDVERGVRIWVAAHERRRGSKPAAAHEARVKARFGRTDAFWVVAQRGDSMAGMALAMPALADDGAGPPLPGRCHVSAVMVNPAYWGQGIGGRIIDTLLEEATRHGYLAAQLWTQVGNDRALRLYERRGFVPTGRTDLLDDEHILQLLREPGPR